MREWNKFTLKKKLFNNFDRFKFTDEQLIADNYSYKERFIFENFKKSELDYKIFNYLTNNLNKNLDTFFIGSSWGWREYFLSKKFNLIASDVSEEYISYHKKNTDLKYIKFDILNKNINKTYNEYFDQIVVNSVEYLFDQKELESCVSNLSKITKKGGLVYFLIRSRDGFIQKLIDNHLTYLETYIIYLIKKIQKNKIYFTKNHHGYRRNFSEFTKLFEQYNFNFQSMHTDMFETEYERLKIIQKLKISKLISKLFFNSHPYLNIVCFKKR